VGQNGLSPIGSRAGTDDLPIRMIWFWGLWE
jgi:hypothetical protein